MGPGIGGRTFRDPENGLQGAAQRLNDACRLHAVSSLVARSI